MNNQDRFQAQVKANKEIAEKMKSAMGFYNTIRAKKAAKKA